MYNYCGGCKWFFAGFGQVYSTSAGECHVLPPQIAQVPGAFDCGPEVRSNRSACSLFEPCVAEIEEGVGGALDLLR